MEKNRARSGRTSSPAPDDRADPAWMARVLERTYRGINERGG